MGRLSPLSISSDLAREYSPPPPPEVRRCKTSRSARLLSRRPSTRSIFPPGRLPAPPSLLPPPPSAPAGPKSRLRLEQLQGRICCLQQSRIRGSRRIHLQSFQHGQSRLHEQSRLRPQILSYLFSSFYLERLESEWQIVEKGRYKGRPLIHVCGEKNTKQTTFYIAMIPQLIFCTNQSQ